MSRHFIFSFFFLSTVTFAAPPESIEPLVINGCGIWPHTRCPGADLRHGAKHGGADRQPLQQRRADADAAAGGGGACRGADAWHKTGCRRAGGCPLSPRDLRLVAIGRSSASRRVLFPRELRLIPIRSSRTCRRSARLRILRLVSI